MQTYQYSAISKDGAKVSGVIEAFDEFAAVASIKETCSVVTKIQAVEQKGLLTRDVFTPKIKGSIIKVGVRSSPGPFIV